MTREEFLARIDDRWKTVECRTYASSFLDMNKGDVITRKEDGVLCYFSHYGRTLKGGHGAFLINMETKSPRTTHVHDSQLWRYAQGAVVRIS